MCRIIKVFCVIICLISCNGPGGEQIVRRIDENQLRIDISEVDIEKLIKTHQLIPVDSNFILTYLDKKFIFTFFDVPEQIYSGEFSSKFLSDSINRAVLKKHHKENRYFILQNPLVKNSKLLFVIYPVNRIVQEQYSLFLLTFSSDDSLLSAIQVSGKSRIISFHDEKTFISSVIIADTLIQARKIAVAVTDLGLHIYDTSYYYFKFIDKHGFWLYKRIYNWELK